MNIIKVSGGLPIPTKISELAVDLIKVNLKPHNDASRYYLHNLDMSFIEYNDALFFLYLYCYIIEFRFYEFNQNKLGTEKLLELERFLSDKNIEKDIVEQARIKSKTTCVFKIIDAPVSKQSEYVLFDVFELATQLLRAYTKAALYYEHSESIPKGSDYFIMNLKAYNFLLKKHGITFTRNFIINNSKNIK